MTLTNTFFNLVLWDLRPLSHIWPSIHIPCFLFWPVVYWLCSTVKICRKENVFSLLKKISTFHFGLSWKGVDNFVQTWKCVNWGKWVLHNQHRASICATLWERMDTKLWWAFLPCQPREQSQLIAGAALVRDDVNVSTDLQEYGPSYCNHKLS